MNEEQHRGPVGRLFHHARTRGLRRPGRLPAAGGTTEPVQSARGTSGATDPENTSPDSAPAVGVQPVPNTPVANIPAHDGHEPIADNVTTLAPSSNPSYSRELWVSPSGDDAAAGTKEAPFKTIAKAIAAAGPGEVVRVLAGTYASASSSATSEGRHRGGEDHPPGRGHAAHHPGPAARARSCSSSKPALDRGRLRDRRAGPAAVSPSTFEGDVHGSVLANSELHHGALGGGVTTYGNAQRRHHREQPHPRLRATGGNSDSHGVVVQPTSQATSPSATTTSTTTRVTRCSAWGPRASARCRPRTGVLIENNHLYAQPRERGGHQDVPQRDHPQQPDARLQADLHREGRGGGRPLLRARRARRGQRDLRLGQGHLRGRQPRGPRAHRRRRAPQPRPRHHQRGRRRGHRHPPGELRAARWCSTTRSRTWRARPS